MEEEKHKKKREMRVICLQQGDGRRGPTSVPNLGGRLLSNSALLGT